MPPNIKLEGIVQFAMPFQDDKTGTDSVGFEQDNEGEFFSGRPSRTYQRCNDNEDEGVRSITSRARYTYTLDRFHRNVMLIINSSIEVDATMHNLNNTFRQYRFDAEVIEANKQHGRSETLEKIYTFFQQDFAEIGAVAVVFLTSTRFKAFAELQDGRIEEQDLMRYFTTNQPAGLLGKPKIFIKEGICITEKYLGDFPDLIPHSTSYDDILTVQANMLYGARNLRPLDLFCSHLNLMKNDHNLVEELPKIGWSARILFLMRSTSIIQYKTTLTKDLLLERCKVESQVPVVIAPSEEDVEANLVKQADMLKRKTRSKKLRSYFYSQWYLENILIPKTSSEYPGSKEEAYFNSIVKSERIPI